MEIEITTLPNDYWLSSSLNENAIVINASTAKEFGLKDGDLVRVVSPTNPDGVWDLKNGQKIPVKGKVKVVQGMRPGGCGHQLAFWSLGLRGK